MKKLFIFLAGLMACIHSYCQTQFSVMSGENQMFLYTILSDSQAGAFVELSGFAYKNNDCEFVSISPTVTYNGKEYTVNSIGEMCFYKFDTAVVEINMPNTIKRIGGAAFAMCTNLRSIDLSNVESIGIQAFYGCISLDTVIVGPSLKTIESYAFEECMNLRSIDLSKVESIDIGAFYDCINLESVTLSNMAVNLTNVFQYAYNINTINLTKDANSFYASFFSSLSSLTSINVEEGNKNFISLGGVLYSTDTTEMLWYPVGNSSLVIEKPTKTIDVYNILKARNIDTFVLKEGNEYFVNINGALYNADTTKLICLFVKGDYEWDNRVDSLLIDYFKSCSGLTSIKIPANVSYIEDGVFENCWNLEKIEVDEKNPYFKSVDGVLYNSDMKKLICYPAKKKGEYTIPETVERIGVGAFCNCNELVSIEIPSTVSRIDKYAFMSCAGLKNVVFPKSIRILGVGAFAGCSGLEYVVLPDTVKSFGTNLFDGCANLKRVVLPSFIQGNSLPDYTFQGCVSLDSVELPQSLYSIGFYSFNGCTSLTEIVIPEKLHSIGDYAFLNCLSFDSIPLFKSIAYVGECAFANCMNLTIYSELEYEPAYYVEGWNITGCPVVWGCKLSEEEEKNRPAINSNSADPINIYAVNGTIVVDNANADVFVFDVTGRIVAKNVSKDQRVEMSIQRPGIYIVKVGDLSKRIAIQ